MLIECLSSPCRPLLPSDQETKKARAFQSSHASPPFNQGYPTRSTSAVKKITKGYPALHSFKIEAKHVDVDLRGKFLNFITDNMVPFKQFFHPIIPSTNSCRMNYQSPQAIRVFYGEQDMSKSTPECAEGLFTNQRLFCIRLVHTQRWTTK